MLHSLMCFSVDLYRQIHLLPSLKEQPAADCGPSPSFIQHNIEHNTELTRVVCIMHSLVPIRRQSRSPKLATCFAVNNVFCVYGFPERIHSDQGTNFESNLTAELLHLAGVAKSHTTANHPMGNGVLC